MAVDEGGVAGSGGSGGTVAEVVHAQPTAGDGQHRPAAAGSAAGAPAQRLRDKLRELEGQEAQVKAAVKLDPELASLIAEAKKVLQDALANL